jgi:hypothetical protein
MNGFSQQPKQMLSDNLGEEGGDGIEKLKISRQKNTVHQVHS